MSQPSIDYRREHAQLRLEPHPIEASCAKLLQAFDCHGLADRGEDMLGNRTDAKYLMPAVVLEAFLEALRDDFNVLEIDGARVFTYENTYFDTPGLALYQAHHNGRRNRRKCRLRRYRETDTSFLEYKLKVNETRTIKQRIAWEDEHARAAIEQWRRAHLATEEALQPALHVNYRRVSLLNEANDDRLTVDYDLRFKRPGEERSQRLPDVFIAELKRPGKLYGSPFYRRAKSYGYLPQGVSKYCIGTCLVRGAGIKQNRFKPLLAQLGRVTTQDLQKI
jgi:VTC domain